MIQRGIGTVLGVVVTLILLVLFGPAGGEVQDYIAPLVIGGVVTFAWPILIVWWLARRRKSKAQAHIDSEVQRQLDERDGR